MLQYLRNLYTVLNKVNPDLVNPLLARTAEQLLTQHAWEVWQTLNTPLPPYSIEAVTKGEAIDCLRTWGAALVCIIVRINPIVDDCTTYYESAGSVPSQNEDARRTAWHNLSNFLTSLIHPNILPMQIHDICHFNRAPSIILAHTPEQHLAHFPEYTEQEKDACLFAWSVCLLNLYVELSTIYEEINQFAR